jgi:hypothetical protein
MDLAPAKVIVTTLPCFVFQGAVQVEQGDNGWMRKDFNRPAGGRLLGDVRINAEAHEAQTPGDGFCAKPPVAGQVLAIGGIGRGLKTSKDGGYLAVTGPAASLVGDDEGSVDGYNPGRTRWAGVGYETEYVVVVAQGGSAL